MDETCVFCRIVLGEEPADFVERGPRHVAFRPRRPHVPGHVLFVPKWHISDAAERPRLAALTFEAAAWYAGSVVRGPANIITSIGAGATQTVFHLHVHVVPRGPADGLRSSWPWRVKPGEELGPGEVA